MRKSSSLLQIGIIGLGQWGPNHVRNFGLIAGCTVRRVCDRSKERLNEAARLFRGPETTTDIGDILNAPDVDAVVIATPTESHFELARAALQAGKDVLCEKPLARTSRECLRLIELAERRGRILMVGHVFLYNAGVAYLKASLDRGELGRIYYLDAVRTNLGPVRRDVGAIYDLASHDISIFNFLLGATPVAVSATGSSVLQERVEDVGFLTLHYPKNVVCHAHASWLNPRKVRQLTVVGDRKMAVWDDMSNLEPIRFYDKGVIPSHYRSFGEFHMVLRDGQITIPKIRSSEPLLVQDTAFVSAVATRKAPAADGRFGLEVVRAIEAASKSLVRRGLSVALPC